MYIIAGSTGTLGTAIVNSLSKENDLFLVGRDEAKLKEQASAINAKYQVIDLNNTVEPREFGKIIDSDIEINNIQDVIKHDLLNYLPDDILCKVDRASMAYGLEVRAPFIDIEVVEFSQKIPFDLKLKNGNLKKVIRLFH